MDINENKFIIGEELLENIIKYLSHRPYIEVSVAILQLSRLEKAIITNDG